MNPGNGNVATAEYIANEPKPERYSVPIDVANLSAANRALLAKHGVVTITRNTRCPCGSGKRFKRCHLT